MWKFNKTVLWLIINTVFIFSYHVQNFTRANVEKIFYILTVTEAGEDDDVGQWRRVDSRVDVNTSDIINFSETFVFTYESTRSYNPLDRHRFSTESIRWM